MAQEQEQDKVEAAYRALLKARATQDRLAEAELLLRLGRLYDDLGLHADSLEYAMEGLRLGEELDNPELTAELLNNIACIHMGRHDWDAAEEFIGRACAWLTRFDHPESLRRVLSNQVVVQIERGHYAPALTLLDTLEQESREAGDTRRLLRCSLLRGWLARLERRWSEALTHLDRARIESAAQSRYDVWIYVLDELSLLYSMPESPYYDPPRAEALLLEGLAWAEAAQFVDALQDVRQSLILLYRQQRRFEEALIQFERLHEQEKKQFSEASERRFQLLQVREETERHRHQAELERLRNDELAEALDEARALRREAERLARHDSLTGLFNRRYLDEVLTSFHQRARFDGSPLAVALVDIDDFKRINDDWSHATGDAVLRAVAEVLYGELRPTDVLGRYGGEEFLVLLPETHSPEARGICERLRQAIAHHPWSEIASGLAVTISLGVCGDLDVSLAEKRIQAADRSLYRAKASGKNQVCLTQ
jgi:diguanylate cyclase (GGDEF)-like protein